MGGGKHPPSAAPGGKSPVLLGLSRCSLFQTEVLQINSFVTRPQNMKLETFFHLTIAITNCTSVVYLINNIVLLEQYHE